ncbi:hypothetical protein [Azospirillum sp. Marseille-Q6669]
MAEYGTNEEVMRRLAEDDFGDDDFDLDSFPAADSDSLLPVEQAHVLARLEDELVELGRIGGRLQRANGTPEAEALWNIAPEGCVVGGAVWDRLWRGIQAAYAEG